MGLGCVKTQRCLIAIEEIYSSKTDFVLRRASELNFKNGLKDVVLAAFQTLAFFTASVNSGTHAPQQTTPLFDHLVDLTEQCHRYRNPHPLAVFKLITNFVLSSAAPVCSRVSRP